MSGTLSLALDTARSGLLTNQAALDVIANNVSNANTEGYSRKDPKFESRTVAGAGAGVEMSQISRQVDEGLRRTIRQELGALNAMDAQGTYFARLQDLVRTARGQLLAQPYPRRVLRRHPVARGQPAGRAGAARNGAMGSGGGRQVQPDERHHPGLAPRSRPAHRPGGGRDQRPARRPSPRPTTTSAATMPSASTPTISGISATSPWNGCRG